MEPTHVRCYEKTGVCRGFNTTMISVSRLLLVLSLVGIYHVRGAGEFATGQYRNLFVEDGHSQPEVDAKINAAFQQLFHGDPNTQAVYFSAGTNANGPLAYVSDIGSGDVRSEGMSYGMMIAVQLDKKAEFDAIWNWAKTFMYHDSSNSPAYGYFSWSMKTNGMPNDEMPAPDGEQYFAMSLYFASGRWGNGSGIYNYRAEADRLLTDLRHRALITGPTVAGTMTAGAIFDSENKMVRFTPDVKNWNHTDPSYQLPAFYELWARWGPEKDRSFWKEAASASRDFFQRAANPVTGLAPDYANFDGTPWAAPWNTNSADFQYDSWRTAMNWSVDWAWWGKDIAGKGAERPSPGVFRIQRNEHLRQPVHVGRPAIWQRPCDGSGGHERRGQPGRHESARETICRGFVEDAGPDRSMALLRRHVVPAGNAPLQR